MTDTSSIPTGPDKTAHRKASTRRRMTRVMPLRALPRVLQELGVELAPLLAETGLPADLFDDGDNRAPVDSLLRLLTRCADASSCPGLGLLIGQAAPPSALGAASRALLGATSVERAVRGVIMNLHLNGEAMVPALTVTGDTACLSVTPYDYHPGGAAPMEDIAIALTTSILRALCGPLWSPLAVTLAHREPPDRRPYDAFFKAPVSFDAESTAVAFDASWLARRPHAAHAESLEPTEASAVPAQILDIATRARRAVIVCMAQGIVGVDHAASLVGLSKRTLNRRLAERGTSTKDLIADVRIQVAQQLMRDTDLSITDIATTTCYADVASFSRAFSARVGMSPAAWRALQLR